MEIKSAVSKKLLAFLFLSSFVYAGPEDWGLHNEGSGIQLSYSEDRVSKDIYQEELNTLLFYNFRYNFKDRFILYFAGYLEAYYREKTFLGQKQIDKHVDNPFKDMKSLQGYIRVHFRKGKIVMDIGKRAIVWGRGVVFNPTSYFGNVNFRSKYITYELPIEGVENVGLSYYSEAYSVEGVYSYTLKQGALRASFFMESVNLLLSISYFRDFEKEENKAGLDFQLPFSIFSIYGEFVRDIEMEMNVYTAGLDIDIPLPFVTKLGVEYFSDYRSEKNISPYIFVQSSKLRLVASYLKNYSKEYSIASSRIDILIKEDKFYISFVPSFALENKEKAGFESSNKILITYLF